MALNKVRIFLFRNKLLNNNFFMKFYSVCVNHSTFRNNNVVSKNVLSNISGSKAYDNLLESRFKTKELRQMELLSKCVKELKSDFSPDEFKKSKDSILSSRGNINELNFDTMFLIACNVEGAFNLGQVYFKTLYLKGNRNLGLIGSFFRLCHHFKEECTETEKSFMIDIYKEIMNKYEILDPKTCESFSIGLSITSYWKEGLKLLEMYRFTASPSVKIYSVIIEAAFMSGDVKLGCKLMQEMINHKTSPTPEVYLSWLKTSNFSVKAFINLFKFFEQYDIQPSEELVTMLISNYKQYNKSPKFSEITSINNRGGCRKCFQKLNPLEISETEFTKLRNEFLDPVLIGKDIFLKTRPDELKSYMDFIKRIEHIDVILDGLNIALSPGQKYINNNLSSKVLCGVVKHFTNKSKKVLVLGRKHMNFWPKNNMNYLKQNSYLFLVDDLSSDDEFILYAAMHFGLGTIFVSRDQMRGHKYRLKDPELKSIFIKWQQKHQHYFLHAGVDGKVDLMEPLPYLQSGQETKPGVWHIPITTNLANVPAHLIPAKRKWFCFHQE